MMIDDQPGGRDDAVIDVTAAVEGAPHVIEMGPSPEYEPRKLRWRLIGAVAALVIAAGAGFAAGHRDTPPPRTTAPQPTPSTTGRAVIEGPAFFATGDTCATLVGDQLQVGAELSNGSPKPAIVASVQVMLPMGGLQTASQQWGPCGELRPIIGPTTVTVQPGGTLWFTATFDVLEACPAPYPVQFRVSYGGGDGGGTLDVIEFKDLGEVPYPGCSTGA